ncbi:bifunctional diguanylate cyclase/phosphodiesterase [Thalassolituus alkanivorans]|uniref:bifunctional diguanylate cyclase/phosphodiesterase n=1 Tax=Thalassolituus alkanivorans TaxID=2881055 RepID=UPI001E61876E|nr:EAL domain-containing protein [Thalassolituus alkanivorans]MCB2385481.1 EAL domain-containing protein [Thalassolituus alkanivorans]MCB2423263.1 EAL domain-containing protein [Thalassolituus alkanivorans]
MRLNTFRSQILLLTAGLTALTSLSILTLVLYSAGETIRSKVNNDLSAAVEVFKNTVAMRQQQLLTSAEILVSDFGFKQALASQDKATVASMLENHGSRIRSDLMFLVDVSGQVTASTDSDVREGEQFSYAPALAQSLKGEVSADFFVLGNHIYQLLLIPVQAPRVIAIAGVGFRMDESLAQQLARSSGIEVTFVEQQSLGMRSPRGVSNLVYSSSLSGDEQILQAMSSPGYAQALGYWGNDAAQRFASQWLTISRHDTVPVSVVLSADLRSSSEGYVRLRNRILQLALIIVLLAVAGSTLMARRLTVPLKRLVRDARAIARGEYHSIDPPRRANNEIQTLVSAFRTMNNDLAGREQKIRYQALHDSLTGLLNRVSMLSELEQRVETGESFMLADVNIRGFKNINDSLGPDVGDGCLTRVAQRLAALSQQGALARVAGDEFVLLIPCPDTATNLWAEAHGWKILHSMATPVNVNGISVNIDVRVGLVLFPAQASTAAQLIRRTNIALEHARSHKLSLFLYEDGMDQQHLQKLHILKSLKQALNDNDGQLQMYYQPQKNLLTGNVDKAEALIRWFHPQDGFIPPDVFIELAEQTGLICQLTDWVIAQVLEHVAVWRRNNIDLQVSINISAQDICRDGLTTLIEHKLQDLQLRPADICLEITERDMMLDEEKSLQQLQLLREHGFSISMDDYGIGYSALSKLARMPVDEIKIDKCFILNLAETHDDQIIVRSTLNMARELGLRVTAEGVENQASETWLQAAGCNYIQGYFLCRPMAFESIAGWLADFRQHSDTADRQQEIQS